jgi:hypothetical protein
MILLLFDDCLTKHSIRSKRSRSRRYCEQRRSQNVAVCRRTCRRRRRQHRRAVEAEAAVAEIVQARQRRHDGLADGTVCL